jgi:hypothetical protein
MHVTQKNEARQQLVPGVQRVLGPRFMFLRPDES